MPVDFCPFAKRNSFAHTTRMADAFVVNGCGGKSCLSGTIAVGGAKNAALQALAFSLLFKDEVSYERMPEIEDVDRMCELLEDLGATITRKSHSVRVSYPKKISSTIDRDRAKRMRASIVLTGPLLARTGEVRFPFPGGCVIGKRPVDVFLDGFRELGADVEEIDDQFVVVAPTKKQYQQLRGAEIFLRVPSVTATQALMMAAVLAGGTTRIKNAALEPETEHLANFLNTCGAKISGLGTTTLLIEGTGLLEASGRTYHVPPDRIEAGCFSILGALAADMLVVDECNPCDLEAVIDVLRRVGVSVETNKSQIIVRRPKKLRSVDIKTHEYPGFPTDVQAPMVVLLTQATGESLVFETIFEGRLNYTEGLIRMGASIKMWDTHRASVKGPTDLRGKELEGPDIRAGLAYIIAGIIADGETIIHNAYYVDRGYESIEKRLRAIGANIKRVSK